MYQFEPDPNLARQQQIFQVWIRPVSPDKAAFAFKLAVHEMRALCANGIPEEEFERAKLFLSKYSKLLLKTPSLADGYRIDSAFHGIPSYPEYVEQSLAALTREQTNAAIARHLPCDNLHLVAVGPSLDEFRKALAAPTPLPIPYDVEVPDKVRRLDETAAVNCF
jgi:zinc protease